MYEAKRHVRGRVRDKSGVTVNRWDGALMAGGKQSSGGGAKGVCVCVGGANNKGSRKGEEVEWVGSGRNGQ